MLQSHLQAVLLGIKLLVNRRQVLLWAVSFVVWASWLRAITQRHRGLGTALKTVEGQLGQLTELSTFLQLATSRPRAFVRGRMMQSHLQAVSLGIKMSVNRRRVLLWAVSFVVLAGQLRAITRRQRAAACIIAEVWRRRYLHRHRGKRFLERLETVIGRPLHLCREYIDETIRTKYEVPMAEALIPFFARVHGQAFLDHAIEDRLLAPAGATEVEVFSFPPES